MGLLALLPVVGKVLDRIIPDPAARDAAKVELLKAQQAGEFRELDKSFGAILAEANSNDPWTSRARPSFMYVMYFFMVLAVPMGVLSAFDPAMAKAIAEGMRAYLEAIPRELWGLFGVGYVGYSASRSYDKRTNARL